MTGTNSLEGAATDGGPPFWVVPRLGPAVAEIVRREKYRKVAVQVPAGLVRNAHDFAAELGRDLGIPAVVVARPCFGACDLPEASEVPGAEVVVALGHAPIPNMRRPLPTVFVEMRDPGGDVAALARAVKAAGVPRRLGLVASIQHMDLVDSFARSLQQEGFEVHRGEGDRRLAYPAQALGCNYTTAEAVETAVEAFLFLGTGQFHPLGLAFAVDRPVFAADPLRGTVEPPIDRAGLIARRQLLVAKCRGARRFGILTSTFAGQDRSGTARALQDRARRSGRDAEIFVFGRLDPGDLVGRDVDAFVNTACPRIALDDGALYDRPMLTVPEFLMVLGELPLAPYRFDTYH